VRQKCCSTILDKKAGSSPAFLFWTTGWGDGCGWLIKYNDWFHLFYSLFLFYRFGYDGFIELSNKLIPKL